MLILTFPISLYLLILSITSPAQSYHWDGNTMYDLEYQGTSFDSEAASWTSSTGTVVSGVLTTQCGSDALLGGYNVMAGSSSWNFGTWSRTYTSLPTHNTITFKGKFYMIDQWTQYNDHFHIYFDTSNTIMWWIYSNYAYATANKCGNPSYNDLDPMMVYFTVPHTSSSLKFQVANDFSSGSASDKQSVGFRDITMTFSTETTVPSFSYCGVTTGFPLPDHACPCDTGKTMIPANSGICITCDSSCLACNAVGRTACTSCQSPLVLSSGSCCDASCKTCTGTSSSDCSSCVDGKYLGSGSCSLCDSSCKTCSAGGSSACTACADGKYLSSGTCYPCDSSCKTCSGAGPSACTACESPKMLFGGACAACDSSCLTCSSAGPTVCATCASKKYLSGTSCQDCDAVCAECSGTSSQCTSCIAGFYNYWNGSCLTNCPSPLSKSTVGGQDYCKFGCTTASDYLYWDGTCSGSCPSPYISEVQGSYLQRKFCWFPCLSGEYLYWNGSCLAQCLSPLKQTTDSTGAKFCGNPCGSSSNYLYSNQSCLSTCPSPLSVIQNPGVQFCTSPCGSASFLYENKTCLSSCLPPFVKRFEPNAQFCDRPCDPGLFWYKNASCLASCPAPYVQILYSGVLQCLPPCKDSEFFYEFEKECDPQCESPFKIKYSDVIKICYIDIQISLAEATKVQGAAASIQSQGQMASGGMKAAGAMNSGSPGSALLAGLSSMLQYIRYMKINYPPKVQMLFLVSAGNPISLGFDFNIPESIAKKLDDNKLPDVFEKYDINSNFVNNLWDFLMTLLIVLIVIGVLSLIKFVVPEKRYPRGHAVLSKVLGAIRWNVPIMMVCSSSGDIFFYASLQIRSSSLDSFSAVICFCVSLVMMIVVFVILVIGFKILQNFKRQAENPNWADKWKGYEILYEEYEEKSVWSLSYMILFIIRGIIFNFTLANLFNFPLIQCIIINVSNVLMFSYLLYLRPLKNFLGLVQLFVNEGLVNIIGVSIIILAIMDKAGISGQSTRVSVGDAIYFVIKVFNTFGLVFLGLSLLVFLVSLFKIWRRLKAQKIDSPMKIFKAMILGEVAKQETDQNLTTDPLKRTRIRKPPRRHSTQTTNQTQANEVIYIEETEMSQVQMFTTDISRSELFSSVSGAHFTPTPGFSPNIHAMRTEESREEDISNIQITEMDVKEENLPSFRGFSVEKSQITMEGKAMKESIETEARVDEIEVSSFLQNLRGRIKSRFRPRNLSVQKVEKSNKKEQVMEERIETGASDLQITEIQNDDGISVNNKSDGFLQNWGRFKGRMKARGAANISLCQDQINGKEAIEERVDTGVSERGIMENSRNNKSQNQSVEFIQNWTKFKRRLKAREPTNISLHQDFSIETIKTKEKEGDVKEKVEAESADIEITEIMESTQNQKNMSSMQSLENRKARESIHMSLRQKANKKEVTEERTETETTDLEITEITETPQNDNKNIGFIKNWGNLKGRMKSKESISESLSQGKDSQLKKTNKKEEMIETEATDIEITEITEVPQKKNQNIGYIQDWRNLKGRVSGAETGTLEKEDSSLSKEIRKLESRVGNNSRIKNFSPEKK